MTQSVIKYVNGDVTKVKVNSLTIIPHCVNSANSFGSGVAAGIAKKWPHVKEAYHEFYRACEWDCEYTEENIPFLLGEVQFVRAEENIVVANFIGQKSPGLNQVINGKTWVPARKEAVDECLGRIADVARKLQAKIIAPKFCSLRAGLNWDNDVVPLVENNWYDLDVTIYEFKE